MRNSGSNIQITERDQVYHTLLILLEQLFLEFKGYFSGHECASQYLKKFVVVFFYLSTLASFQAYFFLQLCAVQIKEVSGLPVPSGTCDCLQQAYVQLCLEDQ